MLPQPVSRRLAVVLAAACCFLVSACELTAVEGDVTVGTNVLTATNPIQRVTKAEIAALGLPVDAEYDVDLVQLVYETPDPSGAATVASGLLAIPVGLNGAAPLLSYQHGTEVLKDGVASVGGMAVGETIVAVVFASAGYVAAMPDYLGLGVSPGLHPYVHAASLATATVDMLRASREAAAARNVRLDGDVFLVGYSEGGSATAAAQRLIETDLSDEFRLVASAPMAGAYDMSGEMVTLMKSPEPYSQSYYLPYLLLAYDDVYDLVPMPGDLFVAPFDTLLPPLYDGAHGSGFINRQLPDVPIEMVNPDYLAAFDASAAHPLRVALRENDLYGWAPVTPTRLYACRGDDFIPFANTQKAYDEFVARGATNVSIAPLDFGGHVDCVAPALLLAKFWFDEFRTGPKRGVAPDPERLRGLRRIYDPSTAR